jgi:hypothetical protein
MTTVDVGGTILRGAFAKWFGRDTLDDNPYPPSPGYYTLHRAWRHGFLNSEAVLMEHDNLTEITAAKGPPMSEPLRTHLEAVGLLPMKRSA